MKYWVFEDIPTPRIRVHEETCCHCNYGRGRNIDEPAPTTKWHGPYSNLEVARGHARELAVARSIYNGDVGECQCCLSGRFLI